jgi:ribosomal protein S18 acetylase RimI-like enzyme
VENKQSRGIAIDFERPSLNDIDQVFDLITRSDMAEYGEPDSELSDLQHEWGRIDLSLDVWVAKDLDERLIGYGAVIPSRGELRFDVYIDPKRAKVTTGDKLLRHCDTRAQELMRDEPISSHTFLAHVNLRDKELFEGVGFDYVKSYYQMHANLTKDLAQPHWPEGVRLRTAIPVEDDEAIYQTVQRAFERVDDEEPTFEQWRTHMIRSDIYDPDLWFLAVTREEIVGTCLGIKYEAEGWIRQFGVVPDWRNMGIATALLQYSFLIFREHGYSRVGLGMEADNQRAICLYEQVGMKVLRQYDEYRKVYTPRKGEKSG